MPIYNPNTAPSVILTVTSKTTTYTATTSDDVILADTSGGAWTLTLYAASGNSGKVLTIKKTTSDFSALTIDANDSETIDGQTTTTVNTQFEALKIICDGSNWHILERKINESWQDYTPANTQGLGTITSVNLKWRRVGDSMQIQGGFATGTVTGSTAQLGLPSGTTIGGTTSSRMYAGETIRNGGSRVTNFAIQGATYLTFGAGAASHGDVIGSSLFGSSEQLYITAFDIPISGWKGN